MSSKFTSVRLVVERRALRNTRQPRRGSELQAGQAARTFTGHSGRRSLLGCFKGSPRLCRKVAKGTSRRRIPQKLLLRCLKRGELQLTQEQRMRLTEEKRRQVVVNISKNYVDPEDRLTTPSDEDRAGHARCESNHRAIPRMRTNRPRWFWRSSGR